MEPAKLNETVMPDLHQAAVSEKELISASIQDGELIYKIERKLSSQDKSKSVKIYTKDLNVNGVVIKDSFEKYLEYDAIQSSHLKQALKTPLHFAFSKDDDKAELDKIRCGKKYFELGTFLHQCILEPTLFSRVLVEPKFSLASTEGVNSLIKFWEEKLQELGEIIIDKISTNWKTVRDICVKKVSEIGLSIEKIDGKKAYYEALKNASGLTTVSEEHFLKILILKRHLDTYANGIIYKILKHSKREISFYYTNENGTKLKVRPDALQFEEHIGVNAIISIKSTSCEDLRAFYYNAAKLHYDLTEGMYQDVVSKVTCRNFNTTIMVMLQTVEPYAVAILVWNKDDIEVGKYKYQTALSIAENATANNEFKGYDIFADNELGLIPMKLPNWNNAEFLPAL